MIPIVKSVITPSNQLFQSISDFFFSGCFRFLLLICFSPPLYIICHMVYHMSSVLLQCNSYICALEKHPEGCLVINYFFFLHVLAIKNPKNIKHKNISNKDIHKHAASIPHKRFEKQFSTITTEKIAIIKSNSIQVKVYV